MDDTFDSRDFRHHVHFTKRMGRGTFSFARSFGGPRGIFGDGFPGGRFVGDGELRLLVLALLAEMPRHGYDVIKALEERSNGFYSPSPGVVYPTLTFLEEAGHAVAVSEGNRKTYTITDAGRAHLEANRETVDAAFSRLEWVGKRMAKAREWFEWGRNRFAGGKTEDGEDGDEAEGPILREEVREVRREAPDRDIPGVIPEVNEARRALKSAIADQLGLPEAGQHRLAEVLNRAAADIRALGPAESEPEVDL